MDHIDWEILNLISVTKSASKVAENLFMSQPAITYRLKKMEDDYHTELFVRTNRGIYLTEAGKVLASFADSMLDKFKQIEISVNMEKRFRETISVGVPFSLIDFTISLIKDFCTEYPDIRFRLSVGTSLKTVKKFQEGTISAAFVKGMSEKTRNSKFLFLDTSRIISKKPLTMEKLSKTPYIDFDTTAIQRYWISNWIEARGIDISNSFYADTIYACFKMVKAGIGWGVVNSLALLQNDCSDLYIYVPTSAQGETLSVSAQYLYSSIETEGLKLFTDFVERSSVIASTQRQIEMLPAIPLE